MTRIPVNNVWPNVVKYYYMKIQNTTKHNIWSWIEEEYNGKRSRVGYHRLSGDDVYDFVFEDDADATAFKLKFMQARLA